MLGVRPLPQPRGLLLLLFARSGRGTPWSPRSPAPELGERKFGEFLGAFLSAPLPQPGSSPFFGPREGVSRNLIQSYDRQHRHLRAPTKPGHVALNPCPYVSLGRVPGPAHSCSPMSCACGPDHPGGPLPHFPFWGPAEASSFRGRQTNWGLGRRETFPLGPKAEPWVAHSCPAGVLGPPSPRAHSPGWRRKQACIL